MHKTPLDPAHRLPLQHPDYRYSPSRNIYLAKIHSLPGRVYSDNETETHRGEWRGHFPDEDSALKVLYLAIRERRPNRANPTGRINGWKNILNVLTMTYGDRLGSN